MMAKGFDPDAYLAETAPAQAAPAFDPDAYLAQTAQYAPSVPMVTPSGQLIRQDAIPEPRQSVPWQQTARNIVGPTVEALGTAAGAIIGTPLGPPGQVVGAGLGYGMSQEVLRRIDESLGTKAPRTGAELITEPLSNVAFGSVMEAGVPKVMTWLGKGAGRVVDFVKGDRADVKAANMLRQSLESGSRSAVEPFKNVLRQAPEGQTAAQATTNFNAPLWQSLNASVARQRGAVDDYATVLANQQANDVADLTRLAGGESATEARKAVAGAKQALTKATEPVKKQALDIASDVSEGIVGLRGEAATAREAAETLTGDVRRMASAAEKAQARANANFPVEGMPRVSGKYSYWGTEAAETADRLMEQAARGSLKFGEAAQLREAALDSLQKANLVPLEGKPLADIFRARAKDPAYAGNREYAIAMNRIAKEIEQWTAANGVIDSVALDAIRKNSVNSIFANSPLSPKAKAKAIAKAMTEVRPAIADAIESAGGIGYREYLDAYQKGIQNINQKQLFGEALKLYKNSPDEFIKLVDGDAPKTVEKIMGYGNFNIASELTPDALSTLRSAAQTLKNAKEMASQSSKAEDALKELLSENISLMRLPSLLSAKFALANASLQKLETKIGKKVMASLIDALKTGKGAANLLDTLPADQRIHVLRVLSDPSNYGVPAGALGAGMGGESLKNYGVGLAQDPVGTLMGNNMLAPEVQNRNNLMR